MSEIVAFIGAQGAGKDTAAAGLTPYYFNKLAFADPVREIASVAFGLTQHEMQDRTIKETPLEKLDGRSPRQVLQLIGTECFRDHFPGVWVKALQRKIFGKTVVTDCRFWDEYRMLRAHGATIVRIDNPKILPKVDGHRSEMEWQEFPVDVTLVNDFETAAAFMAHVTHWWGQYSKLREPTLFPPT